MYIDEYEDVPEYIYVRDPPQVIHPTMFEAIRSAPPVFEEGEAQFIHTPSCSSDIITLEPHYEVLPDTIIDYIGFDKCSSESHQKHWECYRSTDIDQTGERLRPQPVPTSQSMPISCASYGTHLPQTWYPVTSSYPLHVHPDFLHTDMYSGAPSPLPPHTDEMRPIPSLLHSQPIPPLWGGTYPRRSETSLPMEETTPIATWHHLPPLPHHPYPHRNAAGTPIHQPYQFSSAPLSVIPSAVIDTHSLLSKQLSRSLFTRSPARPPGIMPSTILAPQFATSDIKSIPSVMSSTVSSHQCPTPCPRPSLRPTLTSWRPRGPSALHSAHS